MPRAHKPSKAVAQKLSASFRWTPKREMTPTVHAQDQEKIAAAGQKLSAGECPNGCGQLSPDFTGTRDVCSTCNFTLTRHEAPPYDPRPAFNRRWIPKGRGQTGNN